ncbi:MAG: putative molybdenum carrier protein [Pirellulaceae bacterium]
MIRVAKIISGGQTGVDRAALDVAIFLDIEHGGWCPKNRLAEDGQVPQQYQLRETETDEYAVRTERNVVESDGTLVLYFSSLTGGSRLTSNLARRWKKPCLVLDLNDNPAAKTVQDWIELHGIRDLNVAGPRESSVPGINRLAEVFLLKVFEQSPATSRATYGRST